MHPAFKQCDHRPWPLPSRSWTWAQSWADLLFIHWPVPATDLHHLIPGGLTLQEFDGAAWIGVVPFRMMVRPRFTLPVPGLSYFPELNVRTYVEHDGKPGVWFFSLDATNPIAVRTARRFFYLPYHRAQMSVVRRDNHVSYRSLRGGTSATIGFSARYRPTGDPFEARPGSLERWLTERYCLYAQSPEGTLYRGEVHHPPWPLQEAAVSIESNSMLDQLGLSTPAASPLVHFAGRLEVALWSLVRLTETPLPNQRL